MGKLHAYSERWRNYSDWNSSLRQMGTHTKNGVCTIQRNEFITDWMRAAFESARLEKGDSL